MKGLTIKHLNKSQLITLKLPIPPIKNQKIISEIKNNTDDYEFFKTMMS